MEEKKIAEKKRVTKQQAAFFKSLGGRSFISVKRLLDTLPDMAFVMKDRDGHIMALNKRNLSITGFSSESDILEKQSHDYLPASISAIYEKAECEVLQTGKTLINITHPIPDLSSDFSIASKAPLYDVDGNIAGTVSVYQCIRDRPVTRDWFGEFRKIVSYIDEHYAQKIRIKDLLPLMKCSRSQFERLFFQFFKMTPVEYILWVRVNKARDLLEYTDKKITDIAQMVGFCDHSHFIKTFKRLRGVTPRQHRKRASGRAV